MYGNGQVYRMKPSPTRRQVNEAANKKLRRKQAEISGRQPARDPKYLAKVRMLPCIACVKWKLFLRYIEGRDITWLDYPIMERQSSPTEAAHTGPHGIAQKAPDDQAIPLCAIEHHREGSESYHKLGPEFFEHHALPPREEIVAALRRRFAEEAA
jgi:hypothetical protein